MAAEARVSEAPAGPPAEDGASFSAEAVASCLRATFKSGITRPVAWREAQLKQIVKMFLDNREEWISAVRQDLGRCRLEAALSDVDYLVAAAREQLKMLKTNAAPKQVKVGMILYPGKGFLVPEPLGTVLVIGPWNFPVHLLFTPAIGAIAAGNAVCLKPSEVSPNVSALSAKLVPKYLDQSAVAVVEGDKEVVTQLLAQKWDHIFYTGNGTVGRIVMAAAAKHLTPVTLELGGKSPVVVDKDVDVNIVAEKLCYGKTINSGQMCVAPDYVLCHEDVYEPLLEACKKVFPRLFGEDIEKSADLARIINNHHWRRLTRILEEVRANVVFGGNTIEADKYIEPTLIANPPLDARYWKEEIFGPLLGIRPVKSVDEAIEFINEREKPLALYIFSRDSKVTKKIVGSTSSGGVTINDVILHILDPALPFGGVGESGMGAYHGKYSFDTFTHTKSVVDKPLSKDPAFRFPPFSPHSERLLRLLSLGGSLKDWVDYFTGAGVPKDLPKYPLRD